MKTEILQFSNSTVSITVIDNLIYIKVSGVYDDTLALTLIKHLDPLIDELSVDPIRVWDASDIPVGEFKLTGLCIKKISAWAKNIKFKRPDSKSFMIAPSPISFGMARMYESISNLDDTGVIVLHRLDELPASIREKIQFE